MELKQRIDGETLWNQARHLKPGELMKPGQPYIFTENKRRGTKTVSVIREDGKMYFSDIQRVPDSFFDDCARTREHWDGMSSLKRNALGFVPTIDLPDNLSRILYSEEGDGRKQLDVRDPERAKRLKGISNDSDYAKLRLSGGRL